MPDALCQVAPPSTDTSTPATCPSTSVATPLITTGWPSMKLEPLPGVATEDMGGVVSVDWTAATSSDCNVAGRTPISASKFTIACCMSGSVGVGDRSCSALNPHDQKTVPAPNTSAPLTGSLYKVKLWVAVPLPVR